MLSTATREGMKEQVVDNLPKRIKQVKFGIMYVQLPNLWPFPRTGGGTKIAKVGNTAVDWVDKLISAFKVPE